MIDSANILADDLLSESRFFYKASDFNVQLMDSFQKGKSHGETSHIMSLNDIFTIRPGFLYCFTGWPGSGKSEFLTQLSVLQSFLSNRKCAFYSPESYPIEEFIDTVIHCYLGKSTDRRYPNVCSPNEYSQGIKWVDNNFYFCDWAETPDCSTMIKAFDYLHKREGVEIFVVDPFNSLIAEGEDRNIALGLKRNLTAFKRFAAQNKVMVWCVEHPKTPSDNKEYDQIPGPRHLFGGTMWWNKVDVLASVHRPNREDHFDSSVVFKTWKIKKQELNGRPGERIIHFDIKKKRYFPDIHCLEHPMRYTEPKDLNEINDDQPF